MTLRINSNRTILVMFLLLVLGLFCPSIGATETGTSATTEVVQEPVTERSDSDGRKIAYESDGTHNQADNKKKYKVALALGGGGGRGSAHVGVLKVLIEEKIPVDLVVGTSIGSVVGGFFCAGVDIKKIEKMFVDTSLMSSFMTVSLPVRVAAAPIMILPRVIGRKPYDGLYYGNKFRKYLLKHLPDGEKKIENLNTPFAAVAVDLVEGKVHHLTRGNLGYAMQASCAVPGLRKPVQIGDNLYVDGGVMENVPVDQARKLGAEIVIAVNIDEKFKQVPKDTFRRVGSVSKRLVKLQLHNMDQPLTSKADLTIHPDVTGISLLSTKKADALRGIKEGEKAARAKIDELKQLLAAHGVEL